MDPLRSVLDRYLGALGVTLRPSTVGIYRYKLCAFLAFLRTHHPELRSGSALRRVPHIEGWLIHLAQRQPPYANATRRQSLLVTRRFLEDLHESGRSQAPPSGLIRPEDFPPRPRYLPRPLSPEVDRALIGALRAQDQRPCRALLLLRLAGLRIGELRALEQDCLVPGPGGCFTLRVPLGKLHSERVIPVSPEAAALVQALQRERGHPPAVKDPRTGRLVERLLATASGKAIDYMRLNRTLHAVAVSIGVSERVHPHRLRHTYATEMLRNGVSLPALMKLLGHRSLSMTLQYVDVSAEDLIREYSQACSKAREKYDGLKGVRIDNPLPGTLGTVDSAFDELLARIQAIRFEHRDPRQRRKLQRLVERLRRAQRELPGLLG